MWELFAAHGYEATTIKAIADAADVAPRTVTTSAPAEPTAPASTGAHGRASYATAERILAAAIAGDLRVEPDTLAPRLAAVSAVTGLRELYDSREARSLGPEPAGGDLIQLVNQVIDYAIAGLATVTAGH